MRIDHVLIASRDMDATAARLLAEHGLASVEGGRQRGWGTGNRIIPIGDQYLEIIGIADQAEARVNPLGQHVLAMTSDGDTFLGWCVRPDDFHATVSRLGLEAVPGSRARPDGVEVRWRLAGLPEAMVDPWLPFFISWDDMGTHPSKMPVSHRIEPKEFAWVEIGGDAARLKRWLGETKVPIHPGLEAKVTAISLTTASEETEVRI
jgi:hypothetical protein